VLDEQTFLREDRQCLAYGRPRHPEALCERRFGDSMSRRKFALQNHFADPHESPCLLVIHVRDGAVLLRWSVPPRGVPTRAPQRKILDPQRNPPASRAILHPIIGTLDPVREGLARGLLAGTRILALWSALSAKSPR
jgi:hypothetical protein